MPQVFLKSLPCLADLVEQVPGLPANRLPRLAVQGVIELDRLVIERFRSLSLAADPEPQRRFRLSLPAWEAVMTSWMSLSRARAFRFASHGRGT